MNLLTNTFVHACYVHKCHSILFCQAKRVHVIADLIFMYVFDRFTGSLAPSDPLQTLFQLLSGRIPAVSMVFYNILCSRSVYCK